MNGLFGTNLCRSRSQIDMGGKSMSIRNEAALVIIGSTKRP